MGPFWVVGGARSGLAAAILLKKRGYRVFLTDAGSLAAPTKAKLDAAGISWEDGGHDLARFRAEAAALIISPAVLLSHALPLEARRAGIPVFGEIEVGAWFLQGHEVIVAITGTNGKSTTTAYAAQALERAGLRAVACGNIGLPFCEAVDAGYEHLALELSSYQLETTCSLAPDVGVFLNLQKDHLLRYGSLEEYLKAKWRLLLLVKDSGLCVVDADVLELGIRQGLPLPRAEVCVLRGDATPTPLAGAPWRSALTRARSLPIALYHELRELPPARALGVPLGHAHVQRLSTGGLRATWREAPGASFTEMNVNEPVLPGDHNATNLLAASVACAAVGVSTSELALHWERRSSRYVHLPHRLEFVVRADEAAVADAQGNAKRVTLVNDSKATNVESTLVALRSFVRDAQGRGGVRILVGGEPKGESFAPLASFLGAPAVRFYPFGKSGAQITSDLRSAFVNSGVAEVTGEELVAPANATLEEAAERALSDAVDGDVVLLSPACASFDAFRNFEHRGDTFRTWAQAKILR
jgi:UDP-N-acetylmuramoylalanine--D-glutamate ligase